MSIRLALGSNYISGIGGSDWTRNPEWLAVPTTGSQEFAGLIAVYDTDSNFVALSATTVPATGYWVDWGDGYSASYASENTAQYSHSYNSLPSSSYVTTGSYRQVWVRVTPSGSSNLTNINLQKKHSELTAFGALTVTWLDIILSGPNISSLSIGGSTVSLSKLERCQINSISSSLTTCQNLFYNCTNLQKVPVFNTQNVTSVQGMFSNCYSIREIPLLNTQNVSTFSGMCENCYSLSNVPLLNTQNASSFNNVFNSCQALQILPNFILSKATNINNAFANCRSLTYGPALTVVSASEASNLFDGCYGLLSVQTFNTSKITNFSYMFRNCVSMTDVPDLNTSSSTDFTNTFQNCSSLRKVNISGSSRTISYADCNLSKNAILSIFSNLSTASAANQSITMSGNWGTSSLVPSDSSSVIAKGYQGVLW